MPLGTVLHHNLTCMAAVGMQGCRKPWSVGLRIMVEIENKLLHHATSLAGGCRPAKLAKAFLLEDFPHCCKSNGSVLLGQHGCCQGCSNSCFPSTR